jgi:hypothetical protein
MKKIIILGLIVLFWSCNQQPQQQNTESNLNTEETTELTKAVITVDDLIASNDSLLDQTIIVEGLVTHVCKHSGKRLHLNGAIEDHKVRVEAMGDIDHFERALEGSTILVTGVLKRSEGMPSDSEHKEHESEHSADAGSKYYQMFFIEGLSFEEVPAKSL